MQQRLHSMGRVAGVQAVALAAACSPPLDWRELRLDDAGVVVTFPCKPSVYARRLALAGTPLVLTLRVCSAGGSTWAVAHALLSDPATTTPVLQALSAGAAANVGADAPAQLPWAPSGATPNPAAMRWRAVGRLPDGRLAESHTAVFAHGLHVFQATVVGGRVPEEGADAFFAGLLVRG